MDKMVVCTDCASTGFSDKVSRGQFTFEPKDKVCTACGGRGWVPSKSKPSEGERE